MSKDQFPLVDAAGLKVIWRPLGCSEQWAYVYAEDVQAWLERAPVAYAKKNSQGIWMYLDNEPAAGMDTHTARLVLIQLIQPPDTAESLLRELLAIEDGTAHTFRNTESVLDRARALLGKARP